MSKNLTILPNVIDLVGVSYSKNSGALRFSNEQAIITHDPIWLNLISKIGVDWQPPEGEKSFSKVVIPTHNVWVKREAWRRGRIEKSEEVKVE